MYTRIAVVWVVLLCTWLGGSALAQDKPSGTPLSGEDLKTIFVLSNGVVLDGRLPNGHLYSTVFLPYRVAYLQWFVPNGPAGQDSGTWRIGGDTMCFKWKELRSGTEACFQYYKLADNAYQSWTLEGVPRGSFSLRR